MSETTTKTTKKEQEVSAKKADQLETKAVKAQVEKKVPADSKKDASQDSVATVSAETAASKKKKKNNKRQIYKGQAHIQCTYNNTIVTVTDLNGGVLGWASAGILGFKGAKKSTPYAATQIVADVTEKIRKNQIKELEVYVKGVGSGREASIRALSNNGFDLVMIKDITPIPHNGCRPKRPRRV